MNDDHDVAAMSSCARAVLESAATLMSGSVRSGMHLPDGRRAIPRSSPTRRQEDLLRLTSITAAIRGNVDAVPRSLRDFVL